MRLHGFSLIALLAALAIVALLLVHSLGGGLASAGSSAGPGGLGRAISAARHSVVAQDAAAQAASATSAMP